MQEILYNIYENSMIEIKGVSYDVLSKVSYTTRADLNTVFYELKLSSDMMMVIAPSDDFAYIGYVDNNLYYVVIDENTIEYDGLKYIKGLEGYRIVKDVEFGEDYDKECVFTDYEAEDGSRIISFAVLTDTNEKADIIAEVIDVSDILVDNVNVI